jgi:hypothetical protein
VQEGRRAGVQEYRRAGGQELWCILIYCKFMTQLWRTSIREKREKVREKDPISEASAVQWSECASGNSTPIHTVYI